MQPLVDGSLRTNSNPREFQIFIMEVQNYFRMRSPQLRSHDLGAATSPRDLLSRSLKESLPLIRLTAFSGYFASRLRLGLLDAENVKCEVFMSASLCSKET